MAPSTKARQAQRAARAGASTKRTVKVRTSVNFHRPKTLSQPRNPKFVRRAVKRDSPLDAYSVIRFPLTSESAMKKIEDNNTLVFIVDKRADKAGIKAAVKTLYDIEVAKINTLVRPDGQKKAYIRLTPDHDALEVANKIGII
eukprot:m.3413 g.3413  ORF g.3413 m.3413 type:complete len:143 (+) comp5269_c0_seq1:39-467(+)